MGGTHVLDRQPRLGAGALPLSVLAGVALAGLAASPVPAAPLEDMVRLPPGFRIELYARVPHARTLRVVPALDSVIVGTRATDSVFAVVDPGLAGRPRQVRRVLEGLAAPNGIDWRDGYLYVAEQHRLVRFPAPDLATLEGADAEVLFDRLPDNPWHGWRYARFGPDGLLYVAVGAPCNVCATQGLEGNIMRFEPTGGRPDIYATGVRNSVGFDFQPGTGHLYFTDNGADNMGDDSPPDELNHAPAKGLWFGFPHFGGGRDRTPQFRGGALPGPATFPVVEFGAHVAALGLRFYRGGMFPLEYRNDAFVAQHGSWNRTVPDGYRVVRVRFDPSGRATGAETFADGFLVGDKAWGRPVDLAELPDGSLLVSDDRQGAIYRITYSEP